MMVSNCYKNKIFPSRYCRLLFLDTLVQETLTLLDKFNATITFIK